MKRNCSASLAIFALISILVLGGCTADGGPGTSGTSPAREVAASTGPPTATDRGPLQKISGLGVNANVHSWNKGELRPAIDMISELGDVTWRVIIDKADWEAQRNPAEPPAIDWDYYGPIYATGKMADLWDTIEYINTKPGQRVMVNVMGGVPDWMGGSHIDESVEDQWVRMIASMAAYGRNIRHLDFTLISPMNESDHDGIEGPQVEPEQYVRLLHKLLESLDRLGLSDVRLVGPDTASPEKATSDYLAAMDADPLVMSKTDYLSLHSYAGDTAGAREALLQTSNPGLEFWVTEFAGWCPNCDNGSPNPSDWASAESTASLAIRLLEAGASGLQQYDAWDGYYEHHKSTGYWGLLAYSAYERTYSPRKTYFVLKQLIRYTPRDAVRIPLQSSDQNVSAVAFLHAPTGRVTVFGQNFGAETTVTFTVSPEVGPLQLDGFITDSGHDMVKGASGLLRDGRLTYTAAPSSVFTLTGIPTNG